MPAGFTASPDYNFGRLVRDKVIYPDQTYIERFFAYDWRGLPAQKGERFGQTGGSDVEFLTEYRAYDAQGNLQTMIYPSGQRVDLSYGAHGLLSGLQWNAADVMDTIHYAPHGAPQEAHAYGFDGGEIVWRQDFNDRRWPAAIYTDDYSTLLKEPTERTLLELAYQYENNGNITQIDRKYRSVFTGSASYESVLRFDYRYDSLNRLCWAKFDDITYPDTFYGEYEYLMDRYGNISNRNLLSGKGTDPAPPPTISFFIDPDTNRFTNGAQKYTNDDYDVLGNLLWSGTPNESLNIEYMDQGHICRAVDGASGDEWRYYYDADGKRRIKAMSTSGIFDNVSYYFYEGEDLICQQDLGAALQDPAAYDTKFLLVDHLGTTRAEMQFIEDQGIQVPTIVKAYDFMPYGEELAPEVIPMEDVKFTGKQRDMETNFDYFNARFMGSNFFCFSSPDQPFKDNQIENPQSWNLYSYVRSNPISFFDKTGEITASTISCVNRGKGGFHVEFRFVLDHPAPADGYIVQKVTVTKSIQQPSGSPSTVKKTYWEAWKVNSGAVTETGDSLYKITDTAHEPIHKEASGTITSEGEIKFFLASTTGNLGDPGGAAFVPPSPNSGFTNFNMNTEAGGLPSTATQPTWWNNASANNETTATRSVTSTWNQNNPSGSLTVIPQMTVSSVDLQVLRTIQQFL